MSDAVTDYFHREYEKRAIAKEGEPVSPEKQERCKNLNNIEHRLSMTRSGSLQSIQDSLNKEGSSCNVENYLSVLAETDTKLNVLRRYRWYLEEDRVGELT